MSRDPRTARRSRDTSRPPDATGARLPRLLLLAKEMVAFGAVGVVNFGLDVVTYQVMYQVLHQGALVSKVVSTALTTTAAYVMHRHISFAHRGRIGTQREYVRFLGLSVVSLLLGLLVIGAVRYGAGRTDVVSLQIANVASIVVGSFFRFWSYRRWVFPGVVTPVGGHRPDDVDPAPAGAASVSGPGPAGEPHRPRCACSGCGTAEEPAEHVAS